DHAGPDAQPGTADAVPVDVSALTFTALSNRMVFTPAPPLRSGRYRARLTTNALDVAGNRLAPPAPWNFTVLSPAVTAVDPPDGHARPLGGLAELRVRFTDALNPATLAAGLQLALTNGTPVPGGVTAFDADTLTATLAFTAALPGGEYRLRVTTNVTDIYGNPLAAEFTSRFGVHGPVTWAVDADGRWDVAGNWSPARPVPGDDVVLDRPATNVVVTHQTGNTLVSSLAGTESLRLTGGSLTLQSNSLLSGPLLVQGGTLSNRAELRLTGPVTFGPRAFLRGGGTSVFAGPVTLAGSTSVGGNDVEIGGQTLRIEGGPLTWAAGDVTGYSSDETRTHWIISPGATFEATAGTAGRDWQQYGGSLLNRGLFRQTGGTNLLRWFGLTVTNDAVWEINAGHAELQGSLVQSGRLTLAAGTSLALTGNDGVLQLAAGGVIGGPGTFSARRKTTGLAGRFAVTGGATFESLTATFTGELAPSAGGLRFVNCDVVFDNGPLTLSSPLTLREGTLDFRHPTTLGDFRWEFGDVQPTADVTVMNRLVLGATDVGNGARLVGPGRLRVNDGFVQRPSYFDLGTNVVLEHAGSTVWQPRVVASITTLNFDPGAVFRNLANGRFELATNGTVSGRGTFENLGTLVKAANALTNVINVALESPGPLELAGGWLRLGGGGTLGGPVVFAPGTTLEITGASQRPGWLLSGAFTGDGRLRLLGGSNHLSGSLAGPALLIQGATVRLPADIGLTNGEIRSGTLHLDGPLRLAGTNTILTGSNTRVRGPGPVRNDGRVTESVVWFDTDIENAGEWIYATSTRPRYAGLFRNLPGATYTVTNLTGSLSDTPPPGVFDNAGLLRQAGPGNARVEFAVTNRGVIEITGVLTVSGDFTQTEEGLTRLGGGTFSPGGALQLGGEIHGPGIVSRAGSGFYVITNSALLRPGSPAGHGVLTFDASRTHLSPDSLVTVRIGGPAAGTQHDQLRGTDVLWLDGRLRLEFVPGFTPALGQEFLIVSAPSRNWTFRSDFEVAGLPAGLAVRLNYLENGVEAEVVVGP
ncbi:MAG: Ig-like domain-containing protein, partial [Limisphaerales bacterium]